MPTHAERRTLPFPPAQLFDLVADIDQYHEFLPWCVASRVTKRDGTVVLADLVIGYKFFREKFTSRVILTPPAQIDVQYERGPFKYLTNRWRFEAAEDGAATVVNFHVDFQFRSAMLDRLIGAVFTEAVHRMVRAFEKRAEQIYGRPPSAAPAEAPGR